MPQDSEAAPRVQAPAAQAPAQSVMPPVMVPATPANAPPYTAFSAAAAAQPRGYMMDSFDKDHNPVQVFTTSDRDHTPAEFNAVMKTYNTTGFITPGFSVLSPGSASQIMQGYQSVNSVVQGAVQAMDDPSHPINQLPGAISIPVKAAAQLAASNVSTPSRAGATLVTLPAAALIPAGAGVRTVAGIMGLAGAAGGTAARAVTGEQLLPSDTLYEFAINAAGGGITRALQSFLPRAFSGDKVEKVSKQIIQTMVDRHPALANNPYIMDIALKNKDTLAAVTQQLGHSLLGNIDDVSANILADINTVLPGSLSKSETATIRNYAKQLSVQGERIIENMNNPSEAIKAFTALKDAQNNITDTLVTAFSKSKDHVATAERALPVFSKHMDAIKAFTETAEVLRALRQSGAEKGFDPVQLLETIQGTYAAGGKNTMMYDVGTRLGQGTPLTSLPGGVNAPPPPPPGIADLVGKGIDFIRTNVGGHLPTPVQALGKLLFGGKTPPASPLPWMNPRTGIVTPVPSRLEDFGVQAFGNQAIRSFAGDVPRNKPGQD